ncbi:MAG: PQQ-binding-like beta-propeller repeat protein [Pirellulaceae bacterium]|nr:PQQ-binding-like beta-propeller repeat protein [Pirellulaceae bacterium]
MPLKTRPTTSQKIQSTLIVGLTILLMINYVTPVAVADAPTTWPQWRGQDQNGYASGKSFPKQWSEVNGIAWSIDLPGLGGSTPVIAGKHAFLTAGIDGKNTLLAIDTTSGVIDWQAAIGNDAGKNHKKGSGSNPSPVTDGDAVFAYFRSGDLGCVGVDGKSRWHVNLQKEFGEDTLWWDLGSSPMLTDDAVVVAVMQTGPSYVVAFDKSSGKLLWKTDRTLDAPKEAAQCYATPLNVTVGGKAMVAVMGADHLTLHSADDGKELGRLGGFNPTRHEFFRSISSPVAQGNLIVCPYARGATVTAVNMEQLVAGKGADSIAWFRDDLGSDVPTPAAHDGRVYVVDDGKQSRGTVSCVALQTGETIWEIQIPKSRIGFSSSPLLAGDHLYVTQEDGTTHVLGPISSDKPKLIATNEVADTDQFTVASPVPAGDGLLIRTRHRLYKLSGK